MYRDGRVAKHGFGTSSGDFDEQRLTVLCGVGRPAHNYNWIAEVPKLPFDGFLEDLIVADGGLQEGVPVHQPFAAVDEAFAEEIEKRLADGAGAAFVERESGAGPVARAAHLFELV